ncbi:unnamed protein product [Acanthoscelides obtectus]|uniref:Ionotropic receptor 8a n=1 Tax=Acanthoscelides obtectus TaxID=200917 RepID=A0A9P0PMK7_ACAOB|nr:unnamed protein product [Acanthoscelides obtectus]CAK1667865.1 Ionotropic receptor 25a [Acanthoscelides obtectus]
MRPTPNNIAFLGTTKRIIEEYNKALQFNLTQHPDRVNMVFIDFKDSAFDRSLLKGRPVHLLTLKTAMCCRLLNTQEPCECILDTDIQRVFLTESLKFLYKAVGDIQQGKLELKVTKCNSTSNNDEMKRYFEDVLETNIKGQNLIKKENSTLKLSLSGLIEIGADESTDVVATYEDGVVTVVENKTIRSIKPFYRIGITHALPWSYKAKNPATGEEYWTGYCADFAMKIAELMDFDYEFVEPKVGTFGKKIDGVWNGVVGDLATGETDMAITALIMTADKEEFVDFVAPYFEQTGITIVMRKPIRKTSLFKFMTVLKLEVWLSIVAALIVTGFMVWFLDKYSPYSARNNKEAYPYECREFTLKESFWFALTSFTPQGGGEAPKALSGRTLVAAYWLFVVLMLATFTANLAAFLTVERMQAPVQSLEQLARQSRINYTVVRDSETHKYFINMKNAEDTLYRMWKELTLNASTDDTRYRVWDYPIREQYGHILLAINDSDPVVNAQEGFRNVQKHLDADYAFIHDSSEIKYEISKNCNLTEVGEVFAEKPYAVAVQQGSHLQDQISKTILKLQKDRFFEGLQEKYWNHSAQGNCPNTDDNEGITLESLGGVFIATLFGLALAMVTLVGEVLYYRRKQKLEEANRKQQKALYSTKGSFFTDNVIPGKILVSQFQPKNQLPVTIGTSFNPVNVKNSEIEKERRDMKLSHINLYPRARNRITHVSNN